MEKTLSVMNGLKPAMIMVVNQILSAVTNLLLKFSINDGMSPRVGAAYRLIFANIITVPSAIISERKKNDRPKLSWRVLFMGFLCALLGNTLFTNLYFESMAFISATIVTVLLNLAPATTFIMATCFGLERLNIKTASGNAKVLGTIVGIGGAMMLTFFKGVEIDIWSSHINLLHSRHNQNGNVASVHADHGPRWLGIICSIGACLCSSTCLIIQAKLSKEYPSHHSNTALMTLMGAMQSTAFALCVEKDWSQWKLGWNIRLLTVAYSGIVSSGIMGIAITWCVQKKGPLFASVFNPLMLVTVALVSSLALDEKLYLGSVLGAVLIVGGLYLVLWGKNKESKKIIPQAENVCGV